MAVNTDWASIASWIERSEQIFIKKLSRNDCSWADSSKNGHQNGFFIPRETAESTYFPELKNTNPEKPHIYDCAYSTLWPATGEVKTSTIKFFSLRNPGNKEKERPRWEWQHTGVPKEHFSGLSPASLLIGGTLHHPVEEVRYWFMVVDSVSDEAEIIETAFELPSDFHFGLFSPKTLDQALLEEERLIADLRKAIKNGTLDVFIAEQRLPLPSELAAAAQARWLDENPDQSFDPFTMTAPGDAVMRISRDIEYALFKQAELRQRATEAAGLLLRGNDPVSALVRGFGALDRLFLSASQTRKSRAGLSFEQHVQRLLRDGRVAHQAQRVLSSQRPDFVLPDVPALNDRSRGDAVILSLKTTLRERWKQLGHERRHGAVFLATVDDRVSPEAINGLGDAGIVLVVPESLKKSKEACYEKADGVISFRDFFRSEIASRPALLIPGPPPPATRPA